MKAGQILFLLTLILSPLVARADTYTIDKREYISNWCEAPYDKIVAFFPPAPGPRKYYPAPTCTAQYVAKDVVLTALHCIEGYESTTFQISNCKNPAKRYNVELITKGTTNITADWALLRIQDPAGFSDSFFTVAERTPENTDIINAGWGSVRRLSDEEIERIKQIARNYLDNTASPTADELIQRVEEAVSIYEPQTNNQTGYAQQLKINTTCQITGTYSSRESHFFSATCNAQHGNSGGPYFLGETLLGLVSRGELSSSTLHATDLGLKTDVFYSELLAAIQPTQPAPQPAAPASSTQTDQPTSANTGNDTPPDETASTASGQLASSNPSNNSTTGETASTTSDQSASSSTSDDSTSSRTVTITSDMTPVEPTTPKATTNEENLTTSETAVIEKIKNIDNASPTEVLNLVMQMSDLAQLKQQYEKAKEREQSTANKLLGAAAIGATGIGAMNLLSGMAEQSADQDAEQAMRAYLATFTCDYGQGRNIKGGQREVELPGATQLFESVSEYKVLAADLKDRKEALGLRAGIESEVIIDKAETSLYDNAGTGITSGAYTSISRALQDPTGKDAEAWAKQTQDAKSKTKTGAITAGAGALGGAAGNLIINHDKGDDKKSTNNTVK